MGRRDRLRPGQFVLLLAVLAAFAWQSFVTQTHQHFGFAGASAIVSGEAKGSAPSLSDRLSPFDQPASCPICGEIAHAGTYLLPVAIMFDAPAPAAFLAFDAAPLRAVRAGRSHAWRSRAPPFQLQA